MNLCFFLDQKKKKKKLYNLIFSLIPLTKENKFVENNFAHDLTVFRCDSSFRRYDEDSNSGLQKRQATTLGLDSTWGSSSWSLPSHSFWRGWQYLDSRTDLGHLPHCWLPRAFSKHCANYFNQGQSSSNFYLKLRDNHDN